MTPQEDLRARLTRYLDEPVASDVTAELALAGASDVTVVLLAELEELSPKILAEAVGALPELRSRIGLRHAVQWLDLGVAITGPSGAAGAKYFRESPVILGVIEDDRVRLTVLSMSLELAESDPNVALEFFRKSPELATVVRSEDLGTWADIGEELAKIDYVVGIEFIRQSATAAAVLPLDQVRCWVRFGMKLITQNSLGKTDYVGTLEFFRTSPAILNDIEGEEVRSVVLSFGDQLAERDPEHAVTFLAESPQILRRLPSRAWSRRVLQYGLLVAEHDAVAALEYLRRCPELLGILDETTAQAKFEAWFKGGMEVLEYSPEGARAYFALETRKALGSVEQALSGVTLRQVARSLKLFVQGLCGIDVSIESLPESNEQSGMTAKTLARPRVSADGRTISFPPILRQYPARDENVRLYTVMAAHEAGHLEFGTYRLSLASLSDVVEDVRTRFADASGTQVQTLADVFELYPQPGLMRDLWTILEDARVEFLLQQEYPGLQQDLAALARGAVTTRSLLHGMSAREMVVDALLLLTTADRHRVKIPDGIADIVERVWGLAQAVLRPDATAEDSVRAADRIASVLEEMTKGRDVATEGQQDPSSDVGLGPSASDEVSSEYRPVTNWAYRGEMNPELISQGTHSGDERSGEGSAGMPAMPAGWGVGEHGTERSRQKSEEPRQEPSNVGMTVSSSPDSVATRLLAVKDDRRGRHEGEGSSQRAFWYDEWDGTIQDYRTRCCRVIEQWAPESSTDVAGAILAEHGPSVRLIRRYFESIRPPALRRVHGQADGEDFDLDAAIRRKVDQLARVEPVDRIYVRRERRERDVSVAFLVDLSGSTSRHIEADGRRVIDVEREGLILLSEALEAIGDQYAMYGYSGRGRGQVDFLILKDFDEVHRGRSLSRIGAMDPLHQNRDGSAIRHAVRKLRARSAKIKLLILISDGKPLDDGYADEYSLQDTKMALREARMAAVEPFCITVDKEADDYLRRMYGDVRYLVIDRIASLPERLPRVYQRLTA